MLGLGKTADMASIKASYRRLLAEWHPDQSAHEKEDCHRKTQQIVTAYRTIEEYCRQYRYSFSEESVKRHLNAEQWWAERFGMDPVWNDNNDNGT